MSTPDPAGAEARLADSLEAVFQRHDEVALMGQRVYEALKATGGLSSHRLLTYRCPNRRACLLLDILQLPELGIIVHRPRYKYSEAVNLERSNEAGRLHNTEDGNSRWKARTFPLDTAWDVEVHCDHLVNVVLGGGRVAADLEAGRKTVTITPEDHTPPSEYDNP